MTSLRKISAIQPADNFIKVCLLCVFMLFTFFSTYAQNDTIYINKKVIITDTIYKKKPEPEYKAGKKKSGRSFRNVSKTQKINKPLKKEWFAGASGAFMINQNTYTANSTSATLETSEFSSHLSSALSYGAQLNVGIKLNDWSIETGVGYSQLNQDFNYNQLILTVDTTIENYTVVTNEYYLLDTINEFTVRIFKDGNWVEVTHFDVDSTLVSETEDRTREVYETIRKNVNNSQLNKFHYIEIPLIIGREWKTNDFRISAKTGPIFGILSRSSGSTIRLNRSTNQFYVDDLSDEPYHKMSLSFILALGVEYKRYHDVGYFVEPFYRQSLNDLLPTNYRYGMVHRTFGLRFGIRFYFKS